VEQFLARTFPNFPGEKFGLAAGPDLGGAGTSREVAEPVQEIHGHLAWPS
jgi:hypothetical protein